MLSLGFTAFEEFERRKICQKYGIYSIENGNQIGKTMQKGEPIPEGFYHLGADVWIVNGEGKILIQKRSPMKKLSPNLWAMTGGSVIKGEIPVQTIERETLEELGVQLNTENLKLMRKYRTGNVWVSEYLIRQEIDLEDIVMQEDEVCAVKWADFEEIDEMLKNGEFIENRWEFVRDFIREFLKGETYESCDC